MRGAEWWHSARRQVSRRRWDLTALLNAADARAPAAHGHLWLIRFVEWLSQETPESGTDVELDAPAETRSFSRARLHLFLQALDRDSARREAVVGMLGATLRQLDELSLWVDHGFAPHNALINELSERLRLAVLPLTADTHRAGELFLLIFPQPKSIQWLADLDEPTLSRLASLFGAAAPAAWPERLFDAIEILGHHVCSSALAPAIRPRFGRDDSVVATFLSLPVALAGLRAAAAEPDPTRWVQQTTYVRALLSACRALEDQVTAHLEAHGVSVDVVFALDQLKQRTQRIETLIDVLAAPARADALRHALVELSHGARPQDGVRALFGQHYSLLARKIVRSSAGAGEHYIARTPGEMWSMLRQALLGGVVLAFTTFGKFALGTLGWAPFWSGWAAGINYATSFVVVQLCHGVVATKQPASTAPALAAKLGGVHQSQAALDGFAEEVRHLMASQLTGIVGNLLAVVPMVALLQGVSLLSLGHTLIDADSAHHALEANSLWGPTALYAAFTGVLLFLGSLIAGWTENWFILHRLDSAIAWHPLSIALLGASRAQRWARWWRQHIAAVASNVSLGLLLGLVPVCAQFVGLPLEVRHVTLATGQIAAAWFTDGAANWNLPTFWWSVAAIPVIAALNLGVSFVLAFRLALRAREVRVSDRRRVYRALFKRPGVRAG